MQNQPGNLAIKTEKKCKGCINFEPDIFYADAGDLVKYLIVCANQDMCDNLDFLDKQMAEFTGKEK